MDHLVALWQYDWQSKGRSDSTFRNMRCEFERFQRWVGESRTVEAVETRDCLAYLAERRQQSQAATFYAWRTLRSFYGFLEALEGKQNPMRGIRTPKVDEPATKGLTAEEFKQLIACCDVRDRAMITLMWCTGLRRSEVTNLKVSDVMVETGTVLVRHAKSGKPRTVPFSPETKMHMLRYLRQRSKSKHAASDMFWLGVKGPLTSDGLRLMLERRGKEAGIKVSAHMFRRSFAVNWLKDGGSQVSLMSLAGWSTPAMASRYTRHAAGKLADAEYRRMYG